MFKYLIFFVLGLAFALRSELGIVTASILYCSYYLFKDFWPFQIKRLDVSSLFAFALLLNSISHFIALTSNPADVKNYFLRYVPQYLFEGLALYHIGSIVIMESMRYYIKISWLKYVSVTSFTGSWVRMFYISIFIFTLNFFFAVRSIGSVGTFSKLIVFGTVFYLSSYVHHYGSKRYLNMLLIYVSFLSIWYLLFAYLRYEILMPWLAFFLGEAIAKRKLFNFSYKSKVLLFFLVVAIPPLFTYLGKYRGRIGAGSDKLNSVIEGIDDVDQIKNGETIMSRLSYINQLTHIVRLTRVKGFYQGETLEYFTYALIPRIFWPEKPQIKQGQWFALETGLALELDSGRANNSLNMTVPGEFYINFGWPGVLVGCWLFGCFISFLWNELKGMDVFTWSMRFYFIFVGMFGMGADLQLIFTLLAYYIFYKTFKIVLERNDARRPKPLVQSSTYK